MTDTHTHKETLSEAEDFKDAIGFQKKPYLWLKKKKKLKFLFCLSRILDSEPNKEVFLSTLTKATLSFCKKDLGPRLKLSSYRGT